MKAAFLHVQVVSCLVEAAGILKGFRSFFSLYRMLQFLPKDKLAVCAFFMMMLQSDSQLMS